MTPAETSTTKPASKGLHIGLWVAQGLLAFAFLGAGLTKLTMPVEKLAAQMPWVGGALGPWVRFIAAADVAGAIGLVLPAATRIKPRLTALAALGLVAIMVLASITHAMYGEWDKIAVTTLLGALAAFVAWGRSTKAPLAPR